MSETHNGACNHGSTGYCRTCSEESQDAIAELHRLRSPDWITRQQDRDAEIVKLRTERDDTGAKLSAIVKWLGMFQPDVFRRGLWDAIDAALKGDAK